MRWMGYEETVVVQLPAGEDGITQVRHRTNRTALGHILYCTCSAQQLVFFGGFCFIP